MSRHYNHYFKRKVKGELVKAGFRLQQTKHGYKIEKEHDGKQQMLHIHHRGGSKCLKRLKRELRNLFAYQLQAKVEC